MLLKYYQEQLNYQNTPDFLKKYLTVPSLIRLKKVGYFCGMDYASSDIYNFEEYISRFDHSLNVSLIVYNLTNDKTSSIAGLFHDVATPCFSHVIDYMNKDYEVQESTEEYTEEILKNDKYLLKLLEEDSIDVDDIINFKKYSVVDNERPKLCADRLDGVILPGLFWTNNLDIDDVKSIIDNISLYINEDNEEEIGFKSIDVARKVVDVSNSIDAFCHSNEDNYMMELLANITKYSIVKNYFTYENLYEYNEEELFQLIKRIDNNNLKELIYEFENKKKVDIPDIELSYVKARKLNPIVNNKRF